MKLIPLTQGKFAKVDDEDYEYLNQWKWCAHKSHNNIYAERNVRIKGRKQITIKMHRLILGLTDSKILCDHMDHDGLNNTKSNLRACNSTENQRNTSSKKGSSSPYLGVSKDKSKCNRKKRWRASICVNKNRIFIGMFLTEIEAAKAYDNAAIKHFKEFANLNFKNKN